VRARRAAAVAGTIPPLPHGEQDARRWFLKVVATQRELWVAEDGTALVAILVFDGPAIDQLYVEPGLEGRGIGAVLLAHAKRLHPAGLGLWAFQSNAGALRFYERHGFRAVESTDGSGNMERSPDVRLAWP